MKEKYPQSAPHTQHTHTISNQYGECTLHKHGNTLIVRMANLFLAQWIMMSASACHDSTVQSKSTVQKEKEEKRRITKLSVRKIR